MTLLESSLYYASLGWRVFPLKPGAKKPATKNGYLDASTDRDQIEKWWSQRRSFHDRNIGVVTSPASGFWVLDSDIDKETGEFGEDTVEELERQHGALPPTPIQMTPGGGKHRFFAWPDDGGDVPRRIRFLPGLDALGSRVDDGNNVSGYLVIAPSARPDGNYTWVVHPRDCPLPQAPAWLIRIIRDSRTERPKGMPRIQPVKSAGTTPYGRAALGKLCEEIAHCPPGNQDDNLIRKATRIGSIQAGGNIDYQEAFSSAVDAALRMTNQAGREPWTRSVVEKKISKAMAYGARDPTVVEARAFSTLQIAKTPRPEQLSSPELKLIVSNPEVPKSDTSSDDEKKEKKGKKSKEEDEKINPLEWEKFQWGKGLDFVFNEDGWFKATSLHNVQLFMRHHPGLRDLYWYDEFRDEIFVDGPLPGDEPSGEYPRPLQDHDDTALAGWLNANGLSPSITNTAAVLRETAFRNTQNPFLEWLEDLKWDGKKRIDDWLTYYAGVEKSEYSSLVGRKFLISAAARALSPGCKVDTMLILEGPQGLRKSTMIRKLCGDDYFSDQMGDVTNRDSAVAIQGIWIMEIPEMDKFIKAEASALKAFLARLFDHYRPPYGRNNIRRPRRTVFFGSINPDGSGYLKDTTGNRRFWPVACTSIDLEGIEKDREQLWAEAIHEYNKGASWWIDDDEVHIVQPEQDARRDDDVWEPKIKKWLDDPERQRNKKYFTSADVMTDCLFIEAKLQRQSEKIRVAKILKFMKCVSVNNTNGIYGRSWQYDTPKEGD